MRCERGARRVHSPRWCPCPRSVMVGNAQEQLLDWAETQNRDNLYRAQGKVADGILEGIEHFGLM